MILRNQIADHFGMQITAIHSLLSNSLHRYLHDERV